MPQTDVERFVNDLGRKVSLLENVKPTATGLASIAAVGKSLDYNITPDEVKSYIRLANPQKVTSKRIGAEEKLPGFAAVVVAVVVVVVVV
ncbi:MULTISPECIES: hypothetical protein [Sinorhizobium]|uniref:hypothetical protein n=1 Tax=Sinorhizobium TaxID=28105 RepID=UPI000BEA24C2|nr:MULTISPECIES: hypothetical protein [Sinorhizobium]PDT49552.1 hypothetical protein CO664_27185 [Sinorhizobium sp. NG07B]POH33423.1 hypothetical protein ATY30_02310 [Sinorhizobium americanum]